MLLTHIFNFDRQQRAELQTLFQRFVWLIGVNMHLDDVVVVHNHEAIADPAQNGAQAADITGFILALGNKFGAVSKRDVLIRNRGKSAAALEGVSSGIARSL